MSGYDDKPGSLDLLRSLCAKHPKIGTLIHQVRKLDRTHDVPYLGGIATDGRTVYIDRHAPERIADIPIAPYIEAHEAIEYALVRVLGYDYERAHHLATAGEKAVLERHGYDWQDYSLGLRRHYDRIERESLTRLPHDLSIYPYEGRLLRSIVGKIGKVAKIEVHYRDGTPGHRCGICSMFLPHTKGCTIVAGKIAPAKTCDKFEPLKMRAKDPD